MNDEGKGKRKSKLKQLWELEGFRLDMLFRLIMMIPVPVFAFLYFHLLSGSLKYPVEYSQGLLSASSISMGIAGVLITVARFGRSKDTSLKLFELRLKSSLVFSLLYGFGSIIFTLLWYGKAEQYMLDWASVLFLSQMTNIVVFLIFTRYYFK